MRSKKILFSNFSRAQFSQASCIRPDNEKELSNYKIQNQTILARGNGLSYNDSCFNTNGLIIDTSRLNHFLEFNEATGIAICQSSITFKELFLLHPDFIPPVIPGTLNATLGGGIAHDVHGKNNHRMKSLGHHILWFDLLVGEQKIRCSPEQNSDLFYASIAGLGLSGVITRVAIQLQKNTRCVLAKNQKIYTLKDLIDNMLTFGLKQDYQVAWLNLFQQEKEYSILSTANHCDPQTLKEPAIYRIPKMPMRCIHSWNIKLFNFYFFQQQKLEKLLSLSQFNNPLDKIMDWNYLYGPQGLLQFQAVFPQKEAVQTLKKLKELIKQHQATPTLAVLKLFTEKGNGLLSFCQPGFTIAIDFINNKQAIATIKAMNQFILEINGQIYLAKDTALEEEQYKKMYGNSSRFAEIIQKYNCMMHSDLAKRLGILK